MKGETGVDTSYISTKSVLASLKSGADKIDINESIIILPYSGKLNNPCNNDVAIKAVHVKLVTKVIGIDISRFVLNILHNTDKSDLQIKKPCWLDRKEIMTLMSLRLSIKYTVLHA